jgi:hypothetical protein
VTVTTNTAPVNAYKTEATVSTDFVKVADQKVADEAKSWLNSDTIATGLTAPTTDSIDDFDIGNAPTAPTFKEVTGFTDPTGPEIESVGSRSCTPPTVSSPNF